MTGGRPVPAAAGPRFQVLRLMALLALCCMVPLALLTYFTIHLADRATNRTYVSSAYETAIAGHPLVVAAVAPVRAANGGDDGKSLGILGVVYTLDAIRGFADQVARVQGVHLTVTDRMGTVLAGSSKSVDAAGL